MTHQMYYPEDLRKQAVNLREMILRSDNPFIQNLELGVLDKMIEVFSEKDRQTPISQKALKQYSIFINEFEERRKLFNP